MIRNFRALKILSTFILSAAVLLSAASCEPIYVPRPTPTPLPAVMRVEPAHAEPQADYDASYQSVNYERCKILKSLSLKWIRQFSEGLAVAEDKNGLWGFVDLKGEWVIEPEYISADDFVDGYAIVDIDDHEHLIDNTGTVVLDSRDLNGDRFYNSYEDGTIFLLDDEMGPAGSFSYWSLVDMQGNILIDGKELGLSRISSEYEGYRAAALHNDESGSESFGVLDEQTNWVLEPIYNVIDLYDTNTFLASIDNGSERACGIIGVDGQWILKLDGDHIWDFGFDTFGYHDMITFLCDRQGNQLLSGNGFDNIYINAENIVMCGDDTGYKPYYLDGSPAYESLDLKNVVSADADTLLGAVAGENGHWLWGILDPEGGESWLLEPRYDSIQSFEGGAVEGIVLVDESTSEVTFRFEKINSSGGVYGRSPNITISMNAFQSMFFDPWKISD